MKKIIATTCLSTLVALGAFAQGSVNGINNLGFYVTTQGANATDPNNATTWYVGSLTMEVLFSTTASTANINALNAFNGTAGGGAAALSAATGSYGFSVVSLTGSATSSVGSVSGSADVNSNLKTFPNTVYLSTAFGPNTSGQMALYLVGSGAYSTYSGLFAFGGASYGGQFINNPYGTQYTLTANSALATLGGNQNLVLTAPVSAPEPSTMALAGLGGAALLMFRRRK
jgi:PEP-CTERM motif